MRQLLPEPLADVDVHEAYARAWLDRGGVRANMVCSADGASSAGDLTEGLQTPGDKRVFAALRDLADVVVVGWSTADAEGYRPVRATDERRARRTALGVGPHLPLAVVTRSLGLAVTAPVLAAAEPRARSLVVTCAGSDARKRAELAEVADVVVCGTDALDFAVMRRELADRGLTRVLCEGGPTILGEMLRVGEIDELCLSVTPVLTGPGAARIVAGDSWPGSPRAIRLHSLLEEQGALFARYLTAQGPDQAR